MRARAVLPTMNHCATCLHTGLSIPECCCPECCRGLLWRYAPALLDAGPLEASCPVVAPAIQTHAKPRGISESELRRRAPQLEIQV